MIQTREIVVAEIYLIGIFVEIQYETYDDACEAVNDFVILKVVEIGVNVEQVICYEVIKRFD
jgi:hypothetical protein